MNKGKEKCTCTEFKMYIVASNKSYGFQRFFSVKRLTKIKSKSENTENQTIFNSVRIQQNKRQNTTHARMVNNFISDFSCIYAFILSE